MRTQRRLPRATALLVLFASATFVAGAHAGLDGDRYRSDDWRIALSIPKGWKVSDATPYPSILLWMRRPEATMLFSAENLTEVKDGQAYAEATQKSLEKLGYSVRAPVVHSTGAFWLDFDDGEHFLRQAVYVFRTDERAIGYSLTLSTSDVRLRGQMLRGFEYVLGSMRTLKAKPKPVPVETNTESEGGEALDTDPTSSDPAPLPPHDS